jgi:lactoylglutathione lyase
MKYLHSMVRVSDLDASLTFYRDALGLMEVARFEVKTGRFTLVYLCAPDDVESARTNRAPTVELTHNWDSETYEGGRNFGHLAYGVDDIYAICQRLTNHGITVCRPPRDGKMAFVRSPDGISIELLQSGTPLPPAEPWASMPSVGTW